ncbi:hypothetical protein [Heyndrickxia sporothermodurans]|uniref:hypothetical protein n=1 Tax=Heyndrickxia sporothermodurans TaxID=46224 RepID=UPI001FD1959D|nr:hypothetical protein [Heyndrickxia sporothermodurans]
MTNHVLQLIEYEIALLVRLTTAHSPKLGSLDRSEYLLLSELEKSSPLAINSLAENLLLNLSTASKCDFSGFNHFNYWEVDSRFKRRCSVFNNVACQFKIVSE